jgi:hypothetical protein
MDAKRIRHTVAFTLVHDEGSASERDFLEAAERTPITFASCRSAGCPR